MDKFSCKVHRVHMELGDKCLNSLRFKTQLLERRLEVILFLSEKRGGKSHFGTILVQLHRESEDFA